MSHLSPLSVLVLLPTAVLAISLSCDQIVAKNQKFNFKALGGRKDVHFQDLTPPTIVNTTFTIDLCAPFQNLPNIPKDDQCSSGTRVCGIERHYRNGEDTGVTRVIEVAGEYGVTGHGRHLDPKYTRLKDSSSNSDSEREGVRIELSGGVLEENGEKVDQKAIIEMVCDKDKSGNEGFEDGKMTSATSYGIMNKKEHASEDDGAGPPPELPDLDEGKALQFVSYKREDKMDVLRLIWKTKYACEDAADPTPSDGKSGSGLGFFGWLFTVVFLLIAAYIIFGSWLNYNRYGARGWDLVPHGDTIRDIPYIVKDWTGGLADRMKSGGSRGGYSAV